MIRMDVAARTLDVVGLHGQPATPAEVAQAFAERSHRKVFPQKADTPAVRLYKKLAMGSEYGGGFGL